MQKDIIYIMEHIDSARVAVLGLGISNMALIRFLHEKGARFVAVYDKNENEYVLSNSRALMNDGLINETVTGEGYLKALSDKEYDVIFRSPGIRPDLPELESAAERGTLISSEMELFFEFCPCKIYGVTGSDGKTTTTTLLWRLLSAACAKKGRRAWLGGNIGRPLTDILPEIHDDDCAVLELSSFQLMTMKRSPHVSIITNITPNHLDIHKDYDEYINAKKNIYAGVENSLTVLNACNTVTAEIAGSLISQNRKVRLFSAYLSSAEEFGSPAADMLAFERNGVLEWVSDTVGFRTERAKLLVPGKYNAENLLAAVSACADVITQSDIEEALKDFKGVEHRCEFVRELNGVRYYNSSIDSSPNRTIHTLTVFSGNTVMIAGGKDKNIPYDDIGDAVLDKVHTLILTGPTAGKIEAAVRKAEKKRTDNGGRTGGIRILHVKSYEEAVLNAEKYARPGDTVLLSPASTSFDMFRNFEERGNVFKKLVNEL